MWIQYIQGLCKLLLRMQRNLVVLIVHIKVCFHMLDYWQGAVQIFLKPNKQRKYPLNILTFSQYIKYNIWKRIILLMPTANNRNSFGFCEGRGQGMQFINEKDMRSFPKLDWILWVNSINIKIKLIISFLLKEPS